MSLGVMGHITKESTRTLAAIL
jgi:hypothetical protein